MSQKTILVPVYHDTPLAELTPYFEVAFDDGLHLNIQVFAIAPTPPIYTYGYPPYGMVSIPDEWRDSIQTIVKEAESKVSEIEKALTKENVSASVTRAVCELSTISAYASSLALVSDIAFLPKILQKDDSAYSRILSGILYDTPISVVVNPGSLKLVLHPKKVFIAWDGSRQAAKAVQQALPFIDSNCEVHIGWFDPQINEGIDGEDPGTDIAAKLSRHGCKVTLQQYASGGREIAERIQQTAAEFGADLIVMGAYGHLKLQQRIFGGTTKSMLNQTKQAVLLAH